jgi:hypothetical protein
MMRLDQELPEIKIPLRQNFKPWREDEPHKPQFSTRVFERYSLIAPGSGDMERVVLYRERLEE